MKIKRIIALLLATFMVHILATPALAGGEPAGGQSFVSGYVKPVYELPEFTGSRAMRGLLYSSSFPSSFDLRDSGLITPPKNQGSDGVCWAFAAAGLAESLYLRTEGVTYDFSESHIRYATSKDGGNTLGFDRPYNGGGNRYMSTAYLMRWAGPVLEADDPFVPNGGVRDVSITNSKTVVKHIESIVWLPNPASYAREEHRNRIKELLMNYGPVSIAIRHENSYENSTRTAYYYNGEEDANHAVTIVGWDDNYSANNFGTVKPQSNGAWLIKNSWGSYNSLGGYFYLSYEDTYANKDAMAIIDGGEVDNYDRVYEHDPFGVMGDISYQSGNTIEFANMFTAASTDEVIKAVSVFNLNENANYEIYVSADIPSGAQTPDYAEFTKVAQGTFPYTGYITVPIEATPITGDKFAVTVRLTTTDGSRPLVPIEITADGYSSNAKAGPGESFIRPDPTYLWADMGMGADPVNVCVKAYTDSSAVSDGVTITSLVLKDAGGAVITEAQSGDNVNISANLIGNTNDSAKLFFALYRGNRLLTAFVQSYAGAGEYQMPFTLPEGFENIRVKAFLWREPQIPYAYPAEIPLSEYLK